MKDSDYQLIQWFINRSAYLNRYVIDAITDSRYKILLGVKLTTPNNENQNMYESTMP